MVLDSSGSASFMLQKIQTLWCSGASGAFAGSCFGKYDYETSGGKAKTLLEYRDGVNALFRDCPFQEEGPVTF